MNSLIERQVAIESVCTMLKNCFNATDEMLESVKITVGELPSAHQWVSCKERLPKKDGEYLVTMLYFGEKTVEVDKFSHYETDDEHNGEPFWMYGYDNVIAWMPRPEAWKGEEHE